MSILGSAPPYLVVTVGLPRAGKSTWCRKQGWPIVELDAVRRAIHGQRWVATAEPLVWATAKVMARALFISGHRHVLADATNTTRQRRDLWIDPMWHTRFRVFNATAEVCIQRSIAVGDMEIIPVIQKMATAMEPIGPDEQLFESTMIPALAS